MAIREQSVLDLILNLMMVKKFTKNQIMKLFLFIATRDNGGLEKVTPKEIEKWDVVL